ncbi:MAG: hypothetical protein BGP24_09640 [Lysobacterales bacterium 69-70]|nr:hypothetical protein [Xanthomonadaceae bacterium]ODU33218.1 MAG: hypothetical protein ABS97_12665 [Xanthomonadaceae bacterium SCN 69-320]ODV20456.1 MAG: hypothetical protein ABT27_07005 [Xanthomonadaceae bacterium SCN 69-25]OJZ00762.1 MAG: hypothetical protein BGP24_09640 [Xanthomonadales bacterium 69-70]
MAGSLEPAELQRVLGVWLMQADGDPALRFVQEAIAWQKQWFVAHQARVAAGQASDEAVAILVYAEHPLLDPGVTIRPAAARRKDTLYRHALDWALSTGVIVCNENLATMRRIRTGWASISDAFHFAATTLRVDQCFVIAVLGQSRMLVHLPGEDVAAWCSNPVSVTVNAGSPAITAPAIADLIHAFADENLRYPTCPVAPHIWLKGKPFDLMPQPEHLIQSYLLVHLKAAYRCSVTFVDEEARTPGGRADLRIARASPPGSAHPTATTMIELKVLSTAKSYPANVDWALKGVEQANSYRRPDTDAVFAWLFDARKVKRKLPPAVATAARTWNVTVENSPMLDQRPTVRSRTTTSRRPARKTKPRPAR